jgi:hypothetical protein
MIRILLKPALLTRICQALRFLLPTMETRRYCSFNERQKGSYQRHFLDYKTNPSKGVTTEGGDGRRRPRKIWMYEVLLVAFQSRASMQILHRGYRMAPSQSLIHHHWKKLQTANQRTLQQR